MSIQQLSLTDFRNLKSTTLDFHPSLNLIYGDNGSGKTSLLEAIYILCQGGSFRQNQLKKCTAHSKVSFLLFGRFKKYKVGVSKTNRNLKIHINGESIEKRSLLASKSPINILNSDTFELITGSPEKRRQYIDWCLFHVEQTYKENWASFRHILRQRNQLLKLTQDFSLLEYWDEYFIKFSLVLQKMREMYCQQISVILNNELFDLLSDIKVTIEYRQGWYPLLTLSESLKKNREKDIRSGFTHTGIHRDNLLILSDGLPVSDVLSRGQLKRLSLALLVAELKVVFKQSKQPIILLIDDLSAEIDKVTQEKIYQILLSMNVQLFITNIDAMFFGSLTDKDYKMFHVEHGIIKARKLV